MPQYGPTLELRYVFNQLIANATGAAASALATLANSAGEGGSASQGNTGANGRLILEKIKISSLYLDGTGDYLSTTVTGQAPGTGDFTYGAWIYFTQIGPTGITKGIMNTRSGDTTDGFDVNCTGADLLSTVLSPT